MAFYPLIGFDYFCKCWGGSYNFAYAYLYNLLFTIMLLHIYDVLQQNREQVAQAYF